MIKYRVLIAFHMDLLAGADQWVGLTERVIQGMILLAVLVGIVDGSLVVILLVPVLGYLFVWFFTRSARSQYAAGTMGSVRFRAVMVVLSVMFFGIAYVSSVADTTLPQQIFTYANAVAGLAPLGTALAA